MKVPALLLIAFLLLWPSSSPAQKSSDSRFDELDEEAVSAGGEAPRGEPKDLGESQREMLEAYQAGQSRQGETWREASAEMRRQYDRMLERMAREREELRRAVLSQWTEFREPSNKSWVDYNERRDAVTQVDFEKGEVEIEVLVPVEDATGGKKKSSLDELDERERAKLKALARKKIAERTKTVVAQKDPEGIELLEGQLKAPDGSAVTERNAEAYALETLAPAMEIEEKPVVAQDGKPRLKAKVKVELVPEHVRVRAKRYEDRVASAAKKYGLDPALVFAVIHTESYFNPRARSQAPAFGLMQLMPPTAAREAYKYLYREEKLVSPEYLYDPDNNILLGATYLHLLQSRHFAKIKDEGNRRTLVIAAYNCGPGRVGKNIVSRHDVNSLSNKDVRALIQRLAPQETKAYVPKVEERIALYRGL